MSTERKILECKIKQAEVMLAKAELAQDYNQQVLDAMGPLYQNGSIPERTYMDQKFAFDDALLDTQLAQLSIEELTIELEGLDDHPRQVERFV